MQRFTASHSPTRLLLSEFVLPVPFAACAKGQGQPLLSSEESTPFLFIKDGMFWFCHLVCGSASNM